MFGYFDDLIICIDTFKYHSKWVKLVFSRLQYASLSLNKDKCEFGFTRVGYIGYSLYKEGLRPDSERVAPVLNYSRPIYVKKLRLFLGTTGWYSRFIERGTKIKISLLKLLKKEQP